MKKLLVLFSLSVLVIAFASFNGRPVIVTGVSYADSLEADRAKYTAIVNERIKGKEKMTVDSVFTNLKVLGGFPAENLVLAMNSWSRALGVSCGHCHSSIDFALDEKQKKQIAREMVKMGNMISANLKTINGLGNRPIVNCITCHRGELKPAFRMPSK